VNCGCLFQVIDQSKFKKEVGGILQAAGFISKGQTWYLRGRDAHVLVSLQKSEFDEKYYLNLGIWLNAFGNVEFPKENKCHIQIRITSLFSDAIEIIERGCTLNSNDDEGFTQFLDLLRTRLISFCVESLTNEDLGKKFLRGEFSRGLVMKDAKALLSSST